MDLMPGFYCGTTSGIFPVEYCEIPDVQVFYPRTFVNTLSRLKPGQKIYGEFNNKDLNVLLKTHHYQSNTDSGLNNAGSV